MATSVSNGKRAAEVGGEPPAKRARIAQPENFIEAAYWEDIPGAIQLLQEGINPKQSYIDGLNALHVAAGVGKIVFLRFCLDEQLIEVGSAMRSGINSLHLAVINDKLPIAEELLSRGADVHATEIYGKTPLHMAAERGNVQMLSLLRKRGAVLEMRTNFPYAIEQKTPLASACVMNQLAAARFLLMEGADPAAVPRDQCNKEVIHLLNSFDFYAAELFAVLECLN